MGLDGLGIFLVLLAAVLHAGWNALIKGAQDRVMMFCTITLGGALLSALGLPFAGFPALEAWPYLIASVFIHYGYYFFLMFSYKYGDLSHVYPLARGSAPLLVALGAYFFAGEILTPIGLAAIAVASLGIMMLAFEKGLPRGEDFKPVFFALGTGGWIAAYTVVDGMGVRLSEAPIGYILWLFALEGIPFLFWALFIRGHAFVSHFRSNWKLGLGGAMATGTAYGLVIFALSLGNMATVSSLRETSTLIATFLGAFILKEQFARSRYLAAGFVSAGVVVLNYFG